MVTCKWFYRANETMLAQDKQQLKEVSEQELFMSDIMDDNQLSAIEGLCDIRAEPLIDDLDQWLANKDRLVYQSKYVPTEGRFKELTELERSEARWAFGAGARSERLSFAYQSLGALQFANLQDSGVAPTCAVKLVFRCKVNTTLTN